MNTSTSPTLGALQRQFFEMLMQSQFWSADALRDYQRNQLGQLLRHARENVPFYERRLDALYTPNGEIDWDRWTEVPILRRSDLAENGAALKARSLPAGHGGLSISRTSGTSGRSIEVISTGLSSLAIAANRYRAYRWHEIDWGRELLTVFGDDPADAAWPDGAVLGPWGPAWDAATPRGTMRRINRATDNARVVEFMARTQPAYLATGAKIGLAIALEAERLGVHLRLEAFLPQGSMVGDAERDAMYRVFGARIAELYSSKEGGQMAHGCPLATGLHVNAESVLVEIVGEDGRTLGVGEPGRVVITPLFNSAQPLIRYDQGDIAQWMAPCPCGRHLPRLNGLIGRNSVLFHHPDGRARGSFLRAGDKQLIGAREWQIAQTGPHQFEVRFVPGGASRAGGEAALAARLREVYFADAEVRFIPLESLPLGRNGKVAEYVAEWLPDGVQV